MTTWSTIIVRYRGLDARRELLCTRIPDLVATIGAGGDWFYADTNTPDATVPDAEALGEIEAALAVDGRQTTGISDLISTSFARAVEQGVATETATLPRPRLLDPVLFAGSAPLIVYTALLTEGTARAVAILRDHDRTPLPIVAGEVETFLDLVNVEERVLLAEHYARWLEGVARRRREKDPDAGASPTRDMTAARSSAEQAPITQPTHRAFVDEAASLPVAQRYELVARLTHIQAMRLDPTLSLDDEAALVRSLLPRLVHRATTGA